MSDNREPGPVSLREIREEKITVREISSGRPVEKGIYFSSMTALIRGALSLVCFFERIHKDGYVYGANAIEPFRFSLQTGELTEKAEKHLVKAYSIEKEKPEGITLNELLAPELVEAAASGQGFQFTPETDWYFLSVFLFEYFFHTGSPFEGKMMVNRCFLSPLEKEMYRVENGRFCMDIDEENNVPVKGIQDKLIRYWEEYPEMLRRMFRRAFIEGGTLSNLRPSEVDWKQLLVRMAMDYQTCGCGFSGFSFRLREKDNGTLTCPMCGKVYYPLSNGMDRILLKEGGKLYACQTGRDLFDKDTVTGLIVENRNRKGLFGIKNVSDGVWRGMYPDNTVKEIGRGQGIPIWDGMRIRFELGEDWYLKLSRPVKLYEESEVEGNEQQIYADGSRGN